MLRFTFSVLPRDFSESTMVGVQLRASWRIIYFCIGMDSKGREKLGRK